MADENEIDPTDPPAGEAPEPEPFVLPDDFATKVQEWDIPLEDLELAAKQYKALQTDDGVIEAFIATGQSLGFGLKELNRLFDDDPAAAVAAVNDAAAAAAAAPPAEPVDPDALMTRAEVDAMLADVRNEQSEAFKAREQAEFQAKQKVVFDQIDTWFDSNEIKDPAARRAIASFGEKHILPTQDSYDPRVAIAALERGKAEYEAWVDTEAQAYLRRKQAAAGAQPTPVGGGQGESAGGQPAGEAVDYKALGNTALLTAKERVRARLRDSGELE